MPWKESNVMDIRKEFILRSQLNNQSFSSLCREYGISCKTGYKWKQRFLDKGLSGLQDQSRRPNISPTMLGDDCVCELISLKLAHKNWGPAKVKLIYDTNHPDKQSPSLSSVKRILDKSGLVQHRKRRKQSSRITNTVPAEKPNQLWTVDFKGSWYSCDRERIEPLTVRDAYSRYVLHSQALENSRAETVAECFKRIFYKYGLPEAIHSDNGVPFASSNALLGLSRLSAWWIALGITLNRSRPGKPQDNGGHERMHRDLAASVEYCSNGNLITQQAELESWRKEFNQLRPHEALGMSTPSEFYQRSQREYDGEDFELDYPQGYLRRLVGTGGNIKLCNKLIFISTALRGWHVGLQPGSDNSYLLWFGGLCLGIMDANLLKVSPLEKHNTDFQKY